MTPPNPEPTFSANLPATPPYAPRISMNEAGRLALLSILRETHAENTSVVHVTYRARLIDEDAGIYAFTVPGDDIPEFIAAFRDADPKIAEDLEAYASFLGTTSPA